MTVGRCPSHRRGAASFFQPRTRLLQRVSGGWHAKKKWRCLLSFWPLAIKTGICNCTKRSGITFAICRKIWFKAGASPSSALPRAPVRHGGGCGTAEGRMRHGGGCAPSPPCGWAPGGGSCWPKAHFLAGGVEGSASR